MTAAWWDFRDDTGAFTNDVYATWSDRQRRRPGRRTRRSPTSRSTAASACGATARTCGAPPAIASAEEYTVFGWDDTRFGTELAPSQDIFSRAVQFKALGAGNNDTARNLAAAMAGLAIAGLLLLVVALAARRRQPPAPAIVEQGTGQRQLTRSS